MAIHSSQAFVDKLLEFLDLHVSARRGRVRPPVIVPECVPAALRELGITNPLMRLDRMTTAQTVRRS